MLWPWSPALRRVIVPLAAGSALALTACEDPTESALDRCIALEKQEEWARALAACEDAVKVSRTSPAGRLAIGKAALLRDKVVAKTAWEELRGSTAAPASLAPNEDARAAAATLRSFWPLARDVAQSSFRFATCQDEAEGYLALQQCLQTTATELTEAARGVDQLPRPRGGCGGEIASTIAEYIDTSDKWISSFKTWFEANDARLRTAMVGTTLTNACRAKMRCDAQDRSGPTFEKGKRHRVHQAALPVWPR